MTPDPRLVAALAAALGLGCSAPVRHAPAAILAAFLADPRTEKWLAERLHAHNPIECGEAHYSRCAGLILGREP
jgi:hypothetical protein